MGEAQRVRPRQVAEIDAIAYDLIHRFQPKALVEIIRVDVIDLFEFVLEDDTKIRAICDELPPKMGGVTNAKEMTCTIADHVYKHKDRLELKRRLRSTIAHELGHCYLHVQDALSNERYQNIFESDENHAPEKIVPDAGPTIYDVEQQAWRFASSLLMPEACFRVAVRKWKHRTVINGFDVNPSFINVRLRQLGISKPLGWT